MSSYNIISAEPNGTTPQMRWVRLEDGRRGLFKPWNHFQYEAERTYEAIAKFFGLSVSPCVRVDGGFVSLVSYNKRMRQIHSYELDCEYSLFHLRTVISEDTAQQLLLVMFVDAICNNTDRHEGNLAFLKNNDRIIGLCPVYDNCTTFTQSSGSQALLAPTADKVWSHRDVFNWVLRVHPVSDDLRRKYRSMEFLQAVSDSIYFDWIIEQQSYLVGC